MPIAPGLGDNESLREKYFDIMMKRIENYRRDRDPVHLLILKRVIRFQISWMTIIPIRATPMVLPIHYFRRPILKPRIKNKKIKNLFYAGQLTVPGPGVPPSLISGKIAANQLIKHLNINKHEVAI